MVRVRRHKRRIKTYTAWIRWSKEAPLGFHETYKFRAGSRKSAMKKARLLKVKNKLTGKVFLFE